MPYRSAHALHLALSPLVNGELECVWRQQADPRGRGLPILKLHAAA
jgi:hypothetical protein